MMLYSVRMISANMVSVIVKFLLFKEGYLVEMPTLLMFLMFTVVLGFQRGLNLIGDFSLILFNLDFIRIETGEP
jgi:hypothetical protein